MAAQWTIDKEFGFDYGHRVHSQTLNQEYSVDGACVCRHLHGHRAKVQIFLESNTLNEQGMVTDFKHLNWLKNFLDDTMDHKFIIHEDDPLYDTIVGEGELIPVCIPGTQVPVGYKVNLDGINPNTPVYEHKESFFVVNFVPTSENLSMWLYKVAKFKMAKLGVKVTRVDWWETPKSKSTYTE